METVSFIIGALISGVVVCLLTFMTVNKGWKDDCERIGFHLEGSAEQKVYKCELKR